jgi:hypothetical protein
MPAEDGWGTDEQLRTQLAVAPTPPPSSARLVDGLGLLGLHPLSVAPTGPAWHTPLVRGSRAHHRLWADLFCMPPALLEELTGR